MKTCFVRANDYEESSFAEGLSEASLTSALVEGKSTEGDAGTAASRGSDSAMDSNVDLTIVEDEEEALRSPAEVEGNEAFPPQPQKDLECPSSP